jgi:hypothetical protein
MPSNAGPSAAHLSALHYPSDSSQYDTATANAFSRKFENHTHGRKPGKRGLYKKGAA